MRILFALSGLHRIDRGAEIAFTSVASELARQGEEVTLIGSGPDRPGTAYRYIQVSAIPRERFERWPKLPVFRNEEIWEEVTYVPGLLSAYRPSEYDVTVTCGFPFTNWVLRRPVAGRGRPPHVYVTQNGEWPAVWNRSEYRFFGCEGLVCTNPDYFANSSERYDSALIPNGVDTSRFHPGKAERERFAIPGSGPVVLMVSALIPSKNVEAGILAVAQLPRATLVVAGDGPLRDELQQLAAQHLPGRYRQLTVPSSDMPTLYRSADAFLHLSRDESFGNVFVEAIACGTPVVAYELPRTRWILGDKGFYGEHSAAAIAAQLQRAVASRPAIGGALAAQAAKFAWPHVAREYREFLGRVVQRNAKAPELLNIAE